MWHDMLHTLETKTYDVHPDFIFGFLLGLYG